MPRRRGHPIEANNIEPGGANAASGVALVRWRHVILSVGVFALAFALASSEAVAQDSNPQPRIEVAPGVYLASFSEFGPAEAGPVSTRRSTTPRGSDPGRSPRVVGGRKTRISRWPWQVSMSYLPIAPDNGRKSHSCGGSLVSPQVVVTAAHCVTLGSGDFARAPDEFRVISGRTRLSSDAGTEHDLADYFWFVDANGRPLWNRDRVTWDVAFLLLSTPSSEEAIKVAGEGEEAVWAPGQRAFATGWGSTKPGTEEEIEASASDFLRRAKIRMIADSRCDSVYGPILVSELMVCAGVREGGVDVCVGDSGGPLVVPVARGGYRLIGDTSFAAGCGLPRVPGVYGRLAADPIRQALAEGIRIVTGADVVGSGAKPPNRFGIGRRTLRYQGRRAPITVHVPGPGQLRLSRSKALRESRAYPREAGTVRLPVAPHGKARRRLRAVEPGQVAEFETRARITYTPLNGDPRTQSKRIRLVRHG